MDAAVLRRYLAHVDDRVGSFGGVRSVFHDKRVGVPHVDLYIIDAELAGTARIVLLTVGCGLVDRSSERGEQERVELAMVLPATWPMTEADLARPDVFWPLGWLRLIGHELPRLSYGPLPCDLFRLPLAATAPATRFGAVLGVPGEWIHEELGDGFVRPDGRPVRVTALVPVREDERQWAVARGEDAEDGAALVELLEAQRAAAVVIDEDRPSFLAA